MAPSARLKLVESFLGRRDLRGLAQQALLWLRDTNQTTMSVCLARTAGTEALAIIASQGIEGHALASFSAALEEPGHPLAAALHQKQRFFTGPEVMRRGYRWTPFPDGPMHVVPLGGSEPGGAPFGLLLAAGPERLAPDLTWLSNVLGQALSPMLGRAPGAELPDAAERSLLHNIINAVTDPILLTDTEGRLLVANARALMLFTASEEESEGRRGAVRMNNMLLSSALASKAIEETGSARRELLLVNPIDGSDLLFELLSTVTQDPRQGTGVVSILRNVSDLRRASEEIEENYRRLRVAELQVRAERDRLNLIIDSVADPIVVTDTSGDTSLMNEPAERLFTISARATSNEQRWVQSNDAHFTSFIAGMFVSADQRRIGELALIDPQTGEAMPVEAIAGKILSERGELTAVVTILHDRREAMERTRLYQQLKEASDELERKVQAATADIAHQNELLRRQAIELEQASALKTQFLANMSHEFRTPLNAMLGYTSMLLQGVAGSLDSPVKRQLGRIESNGRHLLTIINEILDISRIEAGRMPLQLSRFNVLDLLAEVKSELEPIIMRSKLTVTIHVSKDVKPMVSDRQKVKQILTNLMSNALKFTHKGSITIKAARSRKDRMISLSVRDTGIGIAPEDQDKIFDDFRQLDNSPTRAYGGTGLGLSICRRLAQMLDGQLTLESALGSGSTFTLTLPIQGRR